MTDAHKSIHGFRLDSKHRIDELDSNVRLFNHVKSGARLIHMENSDNNKFFAITFRTPPQNSTGLTHILEHSVLCGSRKFPIKEPFVEMMKGSLHTFLNAFTFADRTMYPVSSRNEKDYFNLIDVYLDAVLHPRLHELPEIFLQEGWHYELVDKEDDLIYKGVVYNEMKGTYSSPESVLIRTAQMKLYPDTSYSFDSGGDPDMIPELNQAEFNAFHQKYYHPANSYIFIYGDVNIDKVLSFLDVEYLNSFDKLDVDSRTLLQKPFDSPREFEFSYPISKQENEKDKTYFSIDFSVGHSTDPVLMLSFSILEHMLLQTPSAPLKRAIIEAGIGKDVLGGLGESLLQPQFGVLVKNSNPEQKEKFQDVVFNTLRNLVQEGIDKRVIEASINSREFKLRDPDLRGLPKGLEYCMRCMNSWLHDGDPLAHLRYEKTLSVVKDALKSNYFEKLIQKYLVDNNHRVLTMLKPERGLDERKTAELKEKLYLYKNSLTDRQIKSIVDQTRALKARQQKPDSAKDLTCIPMLSLNDIAKKAEELPLIEEEINGVRVLLHPIFTSGIGYMNLYFDSSAVPMELIQFIPILSEVLGAVGTKKYSLDELSNEINIQTGGIGFSTETFSAKDSDEHYSSYLKINAKSLMSKLPRMLELLAEISFNTIFDDKKRLREIIQEIKSRLEMIFSFNGQFMAMLRMSSYFSPVGNYQELTRGLSYYKFIANFEKNFDEYAEDIIGNLIKLSSLIFNKNNLLISFTSPMQEAKLFRDNLKLFEAELNSEPLSKVSYKFSFEQANEGLLTQSKVQYVCKGYNYRRLGYNYSGHLMVTKKIIDSNYYWNKIRVQGGAYGTISSFNRSGNIYISSYRDPNLKETLDVFDKTGDFLRNFEADEREISKYIIGTIGDLDFPLTPSMKGETATSRHIQGISQDEIQLERQQVLQTTVKDINSIADLFDDVMSKDCMCTVGNEAKLNENKELFGSLVRVFE